MLYLDLAELSFQEVIYMLDKKTQYELAFAALLHDIGKFKQRAFGGKETEISAETKSMEGQLLPVTIDSRYSYRHALWTYSFFLQDFFQIVHQLNLDITLDWETIAREAAAHHKPGEKGSFSYILAKADHISAAADRIMGEDIGSRAYLSTPLRPIFPNINPSTDHDIEKSSWAYKMTHTNDYEPYATFPQEEGNSECCNYKELWDGFISTLSKIKGQISCQELLRKVKDIMYCYCWCIPSATNDYVNDISLYDHSITTMTFALSLGCSTNESRPFRLLSGDISGIQSYIFQSKGESFKGASKTFRGRSFLISLLAPVFQIGLCDSIGIIPFCDLIEAGGRFSLLLPNTEDIEKIVQDYQKKQEKFLLEKYLGTLCIISDLSSPLDEDDFKAQKKNGPDKGFRKTLRISSKRLSIMKTKKFYFALKETGFVLKDVSTKGNRCISCGKRSQISNNGGYCEACAQELELGKSIPNLDVFHISREQRKFEILEGLWFDDHRGSDTDFSYTLNENNMIPFWRLNNYTPKEDFEEIAEKAVHDGMGKPFLAYIKIDVDHLGDIFIDGFPQGAYTVSRYVTLSRQFHHFFNVHVRNLLETDIQYNDVYTVISGGDDIFLIAPWDRANELIQRIRSDFSRFCCKNEKIHFSTGISIQGKSTPFAFGNSEADRALDEMAKEEFGRNCVCLFGHKYSYEELEKLRLDSEKIQEYIKSGTLTTAFLYRMLQYVRDRLGDESQIQSKKRIYSSYGKFRYDIARNIATKNTENTSDAISFLQARFEFGNVSSLKQFEDSIVISIYMMRKE